MSEILTILSYFLEGFCLDMSPTAEKFGFSSQGDQGRPKAGGFGCCTGVHNLLLSAPLWEGCSVCQPLCFQGRLWDFPQLCPWMLLALDCLAQQSCFSQCFPLVELNYSEFHVQVVFFWGFSQHRERKLANQFYFSLQPSSQVVFDLSKVGIIDVYLFRESLDWNIIKIV